MKELSRIGYTYVSGKRCPLIVGDQTHDYGRSNKKADNWWVKISEDYYLPFLQGWDKIYCWEFKLKENQTCKSKWGSNTLRSGIQTDMILNGRKLFDFGSRDWGYAFSRAQVYMIQLEEHPLNMLDIDSEIGRKVWYREQPATINHIFDHGISLIPDGMKEFKLDHKYDSHEDREIAQSDDRTWIKTDYFDQNVWWFRK